MCWTSGPGPGRATFSFDGRPAGGGRAACSTCLGHWAFRKLDLMVDRRVLIPRPETEVVVEVGAPGAGPSRGGVSLSSSTSGPGRAPSPSRWPANTSQVVAWASDISADALAVASANLAGLGVQAVGRVRLVQGNWWDALPERLQGSVTLAVANPPYVAENELAELPVDVSAWEPVQALVAGPSGLEALAAVVGGAPDWLAQKFGPGGGDRTAPSGRGQRDGAAGWLLRSARPSRPGPPASSARSDPPALSACGGR